MLCIILTLGLWPFHSPKNDVTWSKGLSGLSFGRYATVQSPGIQTIKSSSHGVSGSIEVWVQPKRWTSSATLVAFYDHKSRRLFGLHQSVSDVEVEVQRDGNKRPEALLYVEGALNHALREHEPVFLTVAYGPGGTTVYVDGALDLASSHFEIPQDAFTGRVILGDSPWQPDNFQGLINGLAIYDVELAGSRVSRHYLTWVKTGHPDITDDDRNTALYLFDEAAGTVIHNHASAGVDLYIPETYAVVDKISLEPLWKEFNMSRSYWKAALVNIVGFVPVGFIFYAYFRTARPIGRAMLVAVLVGAATSLTIEIFQSFLPTRDSGTTDLITNTFGTYAGALCYRDLYPNLTKRLPWLGWFLAAQS